jgi:hypothetical protein
MRLRKNQCGEVQRHCVLLSALRRVETILIFTSTLSGRKHLHTLREKGSGRVLGAGPLDALEFSSVITTSAAPLVAVFDEHHGPRRFFAAILSRNLVAGWPSPCPHFGPRNGERPGRFIGRSAGISINLFFVFQFPSRYTHYSAQAGYQ